MANTQRNHEDEEAMEAELLAFLDPSDEPRLPLKELNKSKSPEKSTVVDRGRRRQRSDFPRKIERSTKKERLAINDGPGAPAHSEIEQSTSEADHVPKRIARNQTARGSNSLSACDAPGSSALSKTRELTSTKTAVAPVYRKQESPDGAIESTSGATRQVDVGVHEQYQVTVNVPSKPIQTLGDSSSQAQQQLPSVATRVKIADIVPGKIAARVDGRVCSKTSLRQRSREISVFSFVLQDETGKVNVNAWDAVALRVYEMVKVGECYTVTMVKVKEIAPANLQYNVTDHACELTLTKWSLMTELANHSLPQLESDLLSIIDLERKECNAVIDLLAVVFDVGPIQLINCQDGKPRRKRNVTLVDESCKMIMLGLWPDFTDALNGREGEAVKFQNLQVREYNDKLILSTTTNTVVSSNKEDEAQTHLQQWFTEHGCQTTYEELDRHGK